jgi:hypothetical protein
MDAFAAQTEEPFAPMVPALPSEPKTADVAVLARFMLVHLVGPIRTAVAVAENLPFLEGPRDAFAVSRTTPEAADAPDEEGVLRVADAGIAAVEDTSSADGFVVMLRRLGWLQ